MPVSLVQGLLSGGQMQLGGVQLLPGLLQRSHQLLQLLESTHVDTRSYLLLKCRELFEMSRNIQRSGRAIHASAQSDTR